jgi:hypothetical protein
VVSAFQLVAGCGQTVEVGLDDPLVAAGGSNGAGGDLALGGISPSPAAGESSGMAGAAPCVATACRGQFYACGNCKDDDEDGQVDALDSGCLGPCDNDEMGLSTGLANSSAACRQDCYFDGDAGPGNDKCEWSQQCDELSVAPNYPPSGEERCAYDSAAMGVNCEVLMAEQDPSCLDNCLPLVPNGCDCFGCCELPADSKEYHFIGAGRGAIGCQLDQLDDPVACPPCTQVPSCLNDCKPCEACVGRPPQPSCQSPALCKEGQRSCNPDAPCDFGDYCVTGCCVRAPVR